MVNRLIFHTNVTSKIYPRYFTNGRQDTTDLTLESRLLIRYKKLSIVFWQKEMAGKQAICRDNACQIV